MLERTIVQKIDRLSAPPRGWRVYRIHTENSLYELELQEAAGEGGRRCAVLTCVAPESRAGEVFEDSSPLVGTRSLFDVSPLEWIGGRLFIGTATTSLVQEVTFVSSNGEPGALTRLQGKKRPARVAAVPAVSTPAPVPPPPPKPTPWQRFPDGWVEMAEAAASVLKSLCHRDDLFFSVRADTILERRLQLALAECRLMLDALARR